MEPILASLAFSFLSNVISGVLSNRADSAACKAWQNYKEWKNRAKTPINHDLLRAVYKSLMKATLVALREYSATCSSRTGESVRSHEDREWTHWAIECIENELRRLTRENYFPTLDLTSDQVRSMLPLIEGYEREDLKIQQKMKDEVLNFISKLCSEPSESEGFLKRTLAVFKKSTPAGFEKATPEGFKKLIHEGWLDKSSGERVDWFKVACAFFHEEIKSNSRVSNILMVELLNQLSIRDEQLGEISVSLDDLLSYLKQQGNLIVQRLDAIHKELGDLKQKNREYFEEIRNQLDTLVPYLTILPSIEQRLNEIENVVRESLEVIYRIKHRLSENHIAYLLASRTHRWLRNKQHEMFVGQKSTISRLNDFIGDQKSGIAIVYAPAGYGKTTLIADWLLNHEDNPDFVIVKHFFNREIDNASLEPANAYAHLIAQLIAKLNLQDINFHESEAALRGALMRMLEACNKGVDERKILVVLDGLDESEKLVESFLPDPIPDNLYFIVTGRWDGLGDVPPYFTPFISSATLIFLDSLSEEDIREWLRRAGDGELSKFGDDNSFVRQILKITGGMPLFVRFLVNDLYLAHKENRDVNNVLKNTPKGFNEYVEKQIKLLASAIHKEQGIRQLFSLLTVAVGAVTESEVEELTELTKWDLEALPHSVTRWFSIGESKGERTYSFAHPLLAEAFKRNLGKETKKAEEKLLNWCANWRKHKSPYALRYYSDHLRKSHRYDELFILARDEDYAQVQREKLPELLTLPLRTKMLALETAVDLDRGEIIAEFMLQHAFDIYALRRLESPLQKLKKSGNLKSALELANSYSLDRQIIYHLLLAWELRDNKKSDEVKEVLQKLTQLSERVNKLRSTNILDLKSAGTDIAIEIPFYFLENYDGMVSALAKTLLGDTTLEMVIDQLARDGNFDRALQLVNYFESADFQAQSLISIAEMLLRANDTVRLRQVLDRSLKLADEIHHTLRLKLIKILLESSSFLSEVGNNAWIVRIIDEVYKIAYATDDQVMKIKILCEVAICLSKAGDRDRAIHFVEEIYGIVEDAGDTWIKESTLPNIIDMLLNLGLASQAIQNVENIQNPNLQIELIRDFAPRLMEVKLRERTIDILKKALNKAHSVSDKVESSLALMTAVDAFIRLQEVDEAMGIYTRAHRIFYQNLFDPVDLSKIPKQINALKSILKGLIESGEEKHVSTVLRQLMTLYYYTDLVLLKSLILHSVAEVFVKVGWKDKALKVANEAFNDAQKAEILLKIADLLIERRENEQALQVTKRVLELIETIEDPGFTRFLLIKSAWLFARLNDSESAKRLLDVLAGCEDIGADIITLIKSLGSITDMLVKHNQESMAVSILSRAAQVADKCRDKHSRAETFTLLLENFIKIDGAELREELINKALDVTNDLEYRTFRVKFLINIVRTLAKKEQNKWVSQIITQIASEVDSIPHTAAKDSILLDFIELLSELGMFNAALKYVKNVRTGSNILIALLIISEHFRRTGKSEFAIQTMNMVLQSINKINDDSWKQRWILGNTLMQLVELGDYDRALKLARSVISEPNRSFSLGKITSALADKGQIDLALQVYEEIQNNVSRAEALVALAPRLAMEGQVDRALQLIEGISDTKDHVVALIKIAEALAKSGNSERSSQIAEQVHSRIEVLDLFDDEIPYIAKSLSRLGKGSQAIEVIKRLSYRHNQYFPQVAEVLLEERDMENFKKLITPCAYHLDSAFRMCALLAKAYPDHAARIAELLLDKTLNHFGINLPAH